jgi:hypothetical protein
MDEFLGRQNVAIIHSDVDDAIRREEPSEPLIALANSFSLSQREWVKRNVAPVAYSSVPTTTLTPNPSSLSSLDFSSSGADPLDLIELDPRRLVVTTFMIKTRQVPAGDCV